MKKGYKRIKKKKKKTLFSLWRDVWVSIFLVVVILVIKTIISDLNEIRDDKSDTFSNYTNVLREAWLPTGQESVSVECNEDGSMKEEMALIECIEKIPASGFTDLYIILRDQNGNVIWKTTQPEDEAGMWGEWDETYMQALLEGKQPEGKMVSEMTSFGGDYGDEKSCIYYQGLAGMDYRRECSFRLGNNQYTLLMATKKVMNSYERDYIIETVMKGLIFSLAFSFILAFYFNRIYKKEIALQKQQRDFSNALAHDLKTPLMAISGYAENLAGNICPEKSGHYIEGIQSNVTYMDHLVGQVLDLAKTEQGVAELNIETLELSSMIGKILAQYEILVEKKKLAVTIEGEAKIQADRAKMERVLENLLRNAITYSPEGNKISVKMDKEHLEIRNTGVEISEEDLRDIWKPFITGEKSRSRESGHGLGLSIVANILDLHRFTYEIKSEKQIVCVSIFFK